MEDNIESKKPYIEPTFEKCENIIEITGAPVGSIV
jgi:hypothetical protein